MRKFFKSLCAGAGLFLLIFSLLPAYVFSAHDKPLTKEPTNGSCESGYSLSPNKATCELIFTHQTEGACPAKYDEVGGETSGGCILLRQAVSLCKTDGSEVYDAVADKCVPNTTSTSCPEGQVWDDEIDKCVTQNPGDGGGGGGTSGGTFEIENPLESEDFVALLNKIIDALIVLAVPVTIIMVVWGGLLLTTSAGKPDKVTQARKTILWAVIGFGILLLSKGVASLVQDIIDKAAS